MNALIEFFGGSKCFFLLLTRDLSTQVMGLWLQHLNLAAVTAKFNETIHCAKKPNGKRHYVIRSRDRKSVV